MTELITIGTTLITSASPAIAAAVIGIIVKVKQLGSELKHVKKRLEDYDSLHIEATLAQINTNLEFIKAQIADLARKEK